jgi:5-methylcytosine-specific restriction endonuclease McrA
MSKPSKKLRQNVIAESYGLCVLAGPRCTGVATTVDHWTPRCLGGGNNKANLRAACQECNADKRDMTPDEWWTFVMVLAKRVKVIE